MKKPAPLKSRGVRISDQQWMEIENEADKDKTGRTKPSDIIRHAIEFYLENKDPNLPA